MQDERIDERHPELPDAEPFAVDTLDGVRLRGVVVPSRAGEHRTAVLLCHGFLGTWRRAQNVRLGAALAERYGVLLFDFRGHGTSGGRSTVGDREAIDVHAVVSFARKRGFDRVVTVGASMGAMAVLREAARFRDTDAVVSISSPGRWSGHGPFAKLAGVLVSTTGGRALARRAFRTHVYPGWTWSPPPIEMIEMVEVPTLVIHGLEDRFLPKAQAQLLYARAPHPKRLLLLDGFGHAELGYDRPFGRMLTSEIEGMLDRDGWGAPGDPDGVRSVRLGEGW